MQHIKFLGNRPARSREEDFLRVFTIYIGMAAILVMRLTSHHQIFISMYLKACIQNLVKNCPVVSEKSMF